VAVGRWRAVRPHRRPGRTDPPPDLPSDSNAVVHLGVDRPDAGRRASVRRGTGRRASVLRNTAPTAADPRTRGSADRRDGRRSWVVGDRRPTADGRRVVPANHPGVVRSIVRRAVVTRTIDDPDARSRRTGAGHRPTRAGRRADHPGRRGCRGRRRCARVAGRADPGLVATHRPHAGRRPGGDHSMASRRAVTVRRDVGSPAAGRRSDARDRRRRHGRRIDRVSGASD
jgi:hypothetical protein